MEYLNRLEYICQCDGMADIADLKSVARGGRAGSSPATGTKQSHTAIDFINIKRYRKCL